MIKNGSSSTPVGGDVSRFARELQADRKGFLGYLLNFGYDEGTIVTNDYYTLRSGGVAKNSFVLIRPGSPGELLRPEDKDAVNDPGEQAYYLILARILEPTLTPLAADAVQPFLHLDQQPDEPGMPERPDLQWGTMKVSIVGTFFDDPDSGRIAFGGDVEVFLSPRLYTVHVPTPEMLERLINAFVDPAGSSPIGALRFTESRFLRSSPAVPVRIAPRDFIGARTAIFGRRGTGKANAAKVIAEMILTSGRKVGQVIFDLDGKYAYRTAGEQAALHELHPDRCVRYTLRPEPEENVRVLKANFYTDIGLGHRIITELYSQQVGTPAQYELPFLNWEVLRDADLADLERVNGAAATRYRRQLAIYLCILHAAGFEHDPDFAVDLQLNKQVREALASLLPEFGAEESDQVIRIPRSVPLDTASPVFTRAWEIYGQGSPAFATQSGRAYFDETASSMLTILTQHTATGNAVSGFRKFLPFKRYHSRKSGLLLREVLAALDAGRTVIIDLSNAARELIGFFGGLVARAIFNAQMTRFTENRLGDQYVQLYFEDADQLFPRSDTGPRTFYNRLAQEGSKLHIGMVYSTQRIDALNPDLLAGTENILVAHLNDHREIRALTRFHEFRDVGPDILRTTAPGFVRMVTRSHRFAVPVQVRHFGQIEGQPAAQAPQRASRRRPSGSERET
jgi:hypothetical protein